MTQEKYSQLEKLVNARYDLAVSYMERFQSTAALQKALAHEAELPGFQSKPRKFGPFENKDNVVMMTDIRNSTGLVKQTNGLSNMFLLFYIYASLVSSIVEDCSGSTTEFTGDGVLSLFDAEGGRDNALLNSMIAARDIMYCRTNLLNPFFGAKGLPTLTLGIGIDYGMTIVTRFGLRPDNDLKAFGSCIYNVSKLCKGYNEIVVSSSAISVWPVSPGGNSQFFPTLAKDGSLAYKVLYP
jgi:class 3 adenylate cyclase